MKKCNLTIFRDKYYEYRITRVFLFVRWLMEFPPDSWTYIGICRFNFGGMESELRFCFFGLDLRISFLKEVKK
jgi:hypothetical protein